MFDDTEKARLDALHQLKILDTPASECFDRITRLASQVFSLPIAAISLTDTDRQWFKSRLGVDAQSIPREKAPCAQVAQSSKHLIIEDLFSDSVYSDSLLASIGTRFYAGVPLITEQGYALGALCVLGPEPRRVRPHELAALTDLSEMVMAQIELRHAFGRIDPSSGLLTHRQFLDDMSDLARDHPGQKRFAVVIDLARDEQLTRIRRALGAARISTLISDSAMALRAILGPDRAAYRIGMVHLAFLSPPDVDEAIYLQQLKSKLDRLRASSVVRFVTSVSIGVRPFTLGDVSPEDVMRGAMNAAFDAGSAHGSIALYHASNDLAYQRQYRLIRDFGLALEAADQLRLVYQPRIDLATGQCAGAEALLRWRHPQLGDISPAEFIPIIEQTSLARPATQWVIDAALDQLSQWNACGMHLALSLNISASNLAEKDLGQRLVSGLNKRNLHDNQIELELTESAIMNQADQALQVLKALTDLGIPIAIDDFGTGHSSLAYLQMISAQTVKIDRSFLQNLTQASGADYVLVETMIGLAHKLGYKGVAEGIETAEAARIVSDLRCEQAQGFWFSRPLEAEPFAQWVADHDTCRQ